MSHVLKEVKINCAKCGEYLWRVTRTVYNITLKKTETKEEDPVCKKCDGHRFVEAIKGASRLVTILESEKEVRTVVPKEDELTSPYDQREKKR